MKVVTTSRLLIAGLPVIAHDVRAHAAAHHFAILEATIGKGLAAPARRNEDIIVRQRAAEVGIGNKSKLAGAAQFGIRRVSEGELEGLAGMKEGPQDFPVSCASARARLGVADRRVPLVRNCHRPLCRSNSVMSETNSARMRDRYSRERTPSARASFQLFTCRPRKTPSTTISVSMVTVNQSCLRKASVMRRRITGT